VSEFPFCLRLDNILLYVDTIFLPHLPSRYLVVQFQSHTCDSVRMANPYSWGTSLLNRVGAGVQFPLALFLQTLSHSLSLQILQWGCYIHFNPVLLFRYIWHTICVSLPLLKQQGCSYFRGFCLWTVGPMTFGSVVTQPVMVRSTGRSKLLTSW
jgi:hypothetical protein